jgi:hypothetical protein
MEHGSEQQFETTQRVEPTESVWQRDETTWDTMPAADHWSEQPTAPLPVMRPQARRAPTEQPGILWRRTRGASRQRLLWLGCGGLLLVWFLAILIAAALSTGGIPGLPGIDEPFGPFVQAGPGVTATPTQHPATPLPSASTITPAGTTTATATATIAPEPTATTTPRPSPTAIATATATPTPSPTPHPTATPTPEPTAGSSATQGSTPAPSPAEP